MIIEKKFTPNPSMLYKVTRTLFWKSNLPKIYGVIILILFPVFIFELIDLPFSVFVGWIVFSIISSPLAHFYASKKAFKDGTSDNFDQEYTFNECGIEMKCQNVNVDLKWGKIMKIAKSKNFLLIYFTKNCAYYIPRSIIDDNEIEQLKSWHSKVV